MKTEEIGPSLLAALAGVPDVRWRHGRRSQLPALLTLATAAMLAGARSLYAIAQWGRLPPPEVCRALGFSEGSMPAVTTLHYAFRRLDTLGCEAELCAWATPALGAADRQVILDGKALRGLHGAGLTRARLVPVYAPSAGLLLAQAGGQDPRGPGYAGVTPPPR